MLLSNFAFNYNLRHYSAGVTSDNLSSAAENRNDGVVGRCLLTVS